MFTMNCVFATQTTLVKDGRANAKLLKALRPHINKLHALTVETADMIRMCMLLFENLIG